MKGYLETCVSHSFVWISDQLCSIWCNCCSANSESSCGEKTLKTRSTDNCGWCNIFPVCKTKTNKRLRFEDVIWWDVPVGISWGYGTGLAATRRELFCSCLSLPGNCGCGIPSTQEKWSRKAHHVTACSNVNTDWYIMNLWALQKFKSIAKFYRDTYSFVSSPLPSFCDTGPFPRLQKARQRREKGRGEAGNEAIEQYWMYTSLNYCTKTHTTFISYWTWRSWLWPDFCSYTFQQQSGAIGPRSGTIEPKRTAAYTVRRTRLYHNCKLLAPDGQHLSTIDKRKLEWYLRKGLGSEL